jgi:ubiquitin C-terminal hydrolase
MNAVLQALAHAPELCLAMDCKPHHLTCPIAAENAMKRNSATSSTNAATSILPEDSMTAAPTSVLTIPSTLASSLSPPSGAPLAPQQHPQRTRHSARRSAAAATSSSNGGNGNNGSGGRKSPRSNSAGGGDADSTHSSKSGDGMVGIDSLEFCTLCEVENHIRQVHDATRRDKPFAPTTFVHGFIDHVAPWFQLGVQEDSHEFLRLLIDAMQKSCHRARLQDNPQDVSNSNAPSGTGGADADPEVDTEYPFSLFRGTVESNVVCESCKASSSTLDPIEDVGLEVTAPLSSGVGVTSNPSGVGTPGSVHSTSSARGGGANSSSSRNASPIPAASALTDVQTAFQRFAQTEALDMSYKCETCGKVGRATKQSRLASIPPILTLHLKRFRYGDRTAPSQAAPTRRSCRSEVSQLLGNNDYLTGKSGSAKIEGHIKFDMIFDLKPYLTDELKAKHANMFCRLFAVIVHAGKNSHSGHYIAFVRDVSQNEWWKMDDSRVTAVTMSEVMQAEAYMLLYRVVQHPVAVQLEELHKKKLQEKLSVSQAVPLSLGPPGTDDATLSEHNRKRPHHVMSDASDWMHQRGFPPHLVSLLQKFMEMVADDIQFTERFCKTIKDEASMPKAAIGKRPTSKVCGTLDGSAQLPI